MSHDWVSNITELMHTMSAINWSPTGIQGYGHQWCSWTPMDTYGHPWTSMGTHRHPWIPMDLHGHGHQWTSMDIHGSLWSSMDLHGHPQKSVEFHWGWLNSMELSQIPPRSVNNNSMRCSQILSYCTKSIFWRSLLFICTTLANLMNWVLRAPRVMLSENTVKKQHSECQS